MSKITGRVPMLVSAGSLLLGAMAFGSAATYAYNALTTVHAQECGQACDAEDTDDCPSGCTCNDPTTQCV